MAKNRFRHIIRFFGKTLAVLILVVAALYGALHLHVVQLKLTQLAAGYLSNKLQTSVSVEGVDVGLWDKVILEGVFVADKSGDTLLYVKELSASLDELDFSNHKITIGAIALQNAAVSVTKKDSVFNFQFILAAFSEKEKKQDTVRNKWKLTVGAVELSNCRMRVKMPELFDSVQNACNSAVHFDDIQLSQFNLLVKDIQIDSMLTVLQIAKLSFRERSGFELKNASAQLYINSNTIATTDLQLETNQSKLATYYCNVLFNQDGKKVSSIENTRLEVKIKEFTALADDAGYFLPLMKGNKNRIQLAGEASGTLPDFKIKNIDFRYGKQTRVRGDFSVSGLPKLAETFIFADIKECKTNYTDLNTIQLPPFASNTTLVVPNQIRTLGKMNFTGTITGFVTDFVAYGTATTDAGILYPDTKIAIDTIKKRIAVSGGLRSSQFALGRLLQSDKVGNVTMSIKMNGSFDETKNTRFKVSGDIQKIECLKYDYSNIKIDGDFSQNMFNGMVRIDDPNLFFDFNGSCDFGKKTPEFDFNATIDHAWLHKLHIVSDDSLTMCSADIAAQFKGTSIDDIVGNLLVTDLTFINSKGKVKESEVKLSLENSFQGRDISLQSDALDVSINGDFKFNTVVNDAFLFLKNYVPSLTWKRSKGDEIVSKNIEFVVDVKDIQPILLLFNQEIVVPKPLSVVGNFNPSLNNLFFHAVAPEIDFATNKIKNIEITGSTEDNVFRIESSIDVRLFEKSFRNLRNALSFKNDSVSYESHWFTKDSNVYKGNLFGLGRLFRPDPMHNPMLSMSFMQTDVVVADSVWHINPFSFLVDSASAAIKGMSFSKGCDVFSFYGKLSQNPKDSLVLHIENMDIKNINRLIPDTTINFIGALQGTVSVNDVMGQPIVRADLQASNLFFNGKKLGTLSLKTEWDGSQENLSIAMFLQRGRARLLDFKGTYFPKSHQIALDGELKDVDANTFVSLLPSEVRDLHGLISGAMKVRGPLSAPEFYGTFDFSKISFLINFLKVRYNFTGTCVVAKNKLSFRNVTLNDIDGHTASSDGDIDFNTFPQVGLNLTFRPENFMVLNTRYADNSLYFGKVYATGEVAIRGNPDHAHINISAQTNEKSSFNIPISDESSIEKTKFLTFVSKGTKDSVLLRKQREQVNLTGIELDFNLEITPDVDAKIIFDQRTGDILEANGAGNMHLNIDTKGLFTIYGDYTIDRGMYTLSLGNLLSKRFSIVQGSRISWDGAPLNAMMDVTAQYNTKASLAPLLLMSTDTSQAQSASTRVPVACLLGLKNRLSQLQVNFDVQLPGAANQQAKDLLQNMNEDDRNKQFISLLVLNSFYSATQRTTSSSGAQAGSEILSGQLNKWLSGINDRVNIGVNYRAGDAQTQNQVEVGMSTQFLNDRVTVNVNGYTDVGQKNPNLVNTRQSNQMLGDVNVDVKLNKTGTFRVRGFSRPRPERFELGVDNSQGVGLFYTKEFNSFIELFRRKKKPKDSVALVK